MEELVSLCKRRGFIYQTNEIYGGLQGLYDYGPLGVELKNKKVKLLSEDEKKLSAIEDKKLMNFFNTVTKIFNTSVDKTKKKRIKSKASK